MKKILSVILIVFLVLIQNPVKTFSQDWSQLKFPVSGNIWGKSLTIKPNNNQVIYAVEPPLLTVSLLTPTDDSTVVPDSITFTWSPVSMATKYEFVLYNHYGDIAADSTVTDTSVTYDLGLVETVTWKVRAGNDVGSWSAWSPEWSLVIQPATVVPAIVQLFSPQDGTIVATPTVVLSWNLSANALAYNVVIDTSNSFISPIVWNVTGLSQVTGPLKENITYYWRVASINANGFSPWSRTFSFTIRKPQLILTLTLQLGSLKMLVTVSDGKSGTVTLDAAPVLGVGDRILVPVRAVAEVLGGTADWNPLTKTSTVIVGNNTLKLTQGKNTAFFNGTQISLDPDLRVVPVVINGRTMLPLRFVAEKLGATVGWEASSQTITLIYLTSSSPIILEAADPSAITYISKSSSYEGKNYSFEIIRIDLQGKGIRVVPVPSPSGIDSGASYPTFAAAKPLAIINALPFDTETHVMTGSLGGGGSYLQVKDGFAETIGIDDKGIPFYAEGQITIRVDTIINGNTLSMTTYSINNPSWGGFTVYTNWYQKAIWVGNNEQLVVVDQGNIVDRISGATFQPKLLLSGQYALYGYQTAVNHWTTDTVALLRNADTINLHIFLGERDLTKSFFLQCAPVVLKAGQPIMGAERYPDSFRMTKAGARSFLGIGGGRYLYFIASPTPMSLRTDNVGGALAQLKLFSEVISLDGGGSTTLYYKGKYIYTPGRQLVTCLVVPH